jgi:hypothetical protein
MGRESNRSGGPEKEGQAPVTARGVIATVTALAVVCAACSAGWHRPAGLEPGPLAPRQQVQVWSSRGVLRWHAVRIGADSLSGIPFMRPVDCDSCRATLPRTAVDSIRLGNPSAGGLKTIWLILALPTIVMLVVCATNKGCLTRD